MSKDNIEIISAESENGAGKRGASLGPQALFLEARQQGFNKMLEYPHGYSDTINDKYDVEVSTPNALNVESVLTGLKNLAGEVQNTLQKGSFPLVFSGDHSNGAGGIAGLKREVEGEIGVIWVDAHADLHSPYTTPSGNIHGMPLGMALSLDHLPSITPRNALSERENSSWEELKSMGGSDSAMLKPENLVFIGIRDLEQEEWDIINHYGIKYYGPKEINELGIKAVLDGTFAHLEALDNVYVSFDVDSLDSKYSVGTGTPVANGLALEDGKAVFERCFKEPSVRVFEITEINPLLDIENTMAKNILECLKRVL